MQHLGRHPVDDFQIFRQRVRLHVNLAQVLVQLCQRQLNRRLHRVELYGVCLPLCNLPRDSKLILKHELGQLGEHTGFRAVQIIERARGNIRFRQNLLRRRMLKPLLQKQTHTGRKNSLARGLLFVAVCHLYPSFPCFRIDSNIPK